MVDIEKKDGRYCGEQMRNIYIKDGLEALW